MDISAVHMGELHIIHPLSAAWSS